jgi:hypothetical protein
VDPDHPDDGVLWFRIGDLLVTDPAVKAKTPVYEYEPNTWGPAEVDKNVVPPGGWQNPTVAG